MVGVRHAVHALRRGVDEAADAGLAGHRGETHRAAEIDRFGQARRQLAQGVVRQRGEMDNRVDGGNVSGDDVADVAPDRSVRLRRRLQLTIRVVAGIEAGHGIATLGQESRQDRADVALVAGDEHTRGSGHVPAPTARRSTVASSHDWCVVSTTL